jgi:PAS domain S-box-containing protein
MGAPLSLLVVEDNRADFLLIERHLKRYGIDANCTRVDTLAAVQEAVVLCGWDAILCDYSLPDIEFEQLLAMIRGHLADVPVILVSGCVGETRAVELLRQGVSDFILKDNLARLGPAIERCVQDACDRRARNVAETALRESEERLRLVVEATNDGLWDWDVRSGNVILSPRFYQMTGYQPDDIEPNLEFLDNIIHPDDLSHVHDSVGAHLRGNSPATEVEYRMVTRSGAIMWVRARGRVVKRDDGGAPLRVVGTIMDITGRKADEEALRRQSEELTQRNLELTRFNRAAVGRELDMIAIKERINDLSRQLGRDPPFPQRHLQELAPSATEAKR